jgi:hypothetical protein
MKEENKQDLMEPNLWPYDWRERYWRERSEEGRNMPKVPENCERLVALLSEDIQASLSQIRHTIDEYEEYAGDRQMNALESPIDLSILEGLRQEMERLAKYGLETLQQ